MAGLGAAQFPAGGALGRRGFGGGADGEQEADHFALAAGSGFGEDAFEVGLGGFGGDEEAGSGFLDSESGDEEGGEADFGGSEAEQGGEGAGVGLSAEFGVDDGDGGDGLDAAHGESAGAVDGGGGQPEGAAGGGTVDDEALDGGAAGPGLFEPGGEILARGEVLTTEGESIGIGEDVAQAAIGEQEGSVLGEKGETVGEVIEVFLRGVAFGGEAGEAFVLACGDLEVGDELIDPLEFGVGDGTAVFGAQGAEEGEEGIGAQQDDAEAIVPVAGSQKALVDLGGFEEVVGGDFVAAADDADGGILLDARHPGVLVAPVLFVFEPVLFGCAGVAGDAIDDKAAGEDVERTLGGAEGGVEAFEKRLPEGGVFGGSMDLEDQFVDGTAVSHAGRQHAAAIGIRSRIRE